MTTTKEIAPFLRNLRRMLDTEHASIICWTPDGAAFEIHDLARLVAHVLPKYFKHAKYSSFQRQLNYFSFRKWTRSKTAVCTFSNPHFQRDAPDLTWRITRKKSSPAAAKTRLSIVVPKVTSPSKTTELYDGFQSPTDATAMLHTQPQVNSPASPLLPPDSALEPALLDWCYLYGPMDQPAFESMDMALDNASPASLDWIDSLYSSLEAPSSRPSGFLL